MEERGHIRSESFAFSRSIINLLFFNYSRVRVVSCYSSAEDERLLAIVDEKKKL